MHRDPLLESAKIKEEIIFLSAKMIESKINVAITAEDYSKILKQINDLRDFIEGK